MSEAQDGAVGAPAAAPGSEAQDEEAVPAPAPGAAEAGAPSPAVEGGEDSAVEAPEEETGDGKASVAGVETALRCKRKEAMEGGEDESDSRERKRRKHEAASDFAKGIGWPSKKPRARRFMHGWFLATHERVFDHVLTEDVTTILELGSWYGASTEWLAKKCPSAKIYAVDLWEDDFILDEQRDHYGTMGETKLTRMLREHPLYDTFLANLWDYKATVVPLKMQTVDGVRHLKDKGIVPQIIYIDADHHYASVKKDIEACLDAFPDAICVGDDYGHYDDVRNAVTECATKYNKTVHVDQNHCWTYVAIDSVTGRNFVPKPKATTSFADLLANFAK